MGLKLAWDNTQTEELINIEPASPRLSMIAVYRCYNIRSCALLRSCPEAQNPAQISALRDLAKTGHAISADDGNIHVKSLFVVTHATTVKG